MKIKSYVKLCCDTNPENTVQRTLITRKLAVNISTIVISVFEQVTVLQIFNYFKQLPNNQNYKKKFFSIE